MSRGDHRNESVGKATAAVASASAHHWEVEEDHLLSYFLGGEGNNTDTDAAPEKDVEHNAEPDVPDHSDLRHGSASAPILGQNSQESKSPESGILKRSTSMGRTSHSVHFLDNIPEEPALNHPSAMHARIGSHDSMHTAPSIASSSSSSLSTMAAAMAIGGPSQLMYIQQKLQGREVPVPAAHLNNTSPITPVNMMGTPTGQEMMMLPPPPRFPSGSGIAPQHDMSVQQPHYFHQTESQVFPPVHMNNMQPQWNQQQQGHSPNTLQHLSWIQQMNAACMAAQQQHAVQPHQGQQATQQPGVVGQSPVPNAVVSQAQQGQNVSFQSQQPQAQHQIQVGVDGATVPVTAVTNPDGSVSYHIDPTTAAVPQSGLRYLTKAINEVVKPEEPEKEDPAVLAEKRQRRLARNRESARQSRRRKKDHLNNLAEKVKRLQRQLETEVTTQIKSMESGLSELRSSLLVQFSDGMNADHENLHMLVQGTSPNCSIRRAVTLHQYNCLRQAFLSTHNHCSVWLMMKNSQYFADGCRQSQKPVETKGSKAVASRPNSKQVGEDIVNNEKTGESPITSSSEDAPRMWPLLCHELTMTMDQEERIINQAHVEAKSTKNLNTKLRNTVKATSATHTLRNAMLCLSQCSSELNEVLLLNILTPQQTILFLQWSKKNKERLKAVMERRQQSFENVQNGHGLNFAYSELESIKNL